jgi:hypothetical protein
VVAAVFTTLIAVAVQLVVLVVVMAQPQPHRDLHLVREMPEVFTISLLVTKMQVVAAVLLELVAMEMLQLTTVVLVEQVLLLTQVGDLFQQL